MADTFMEIWTLRRGRITPPERIHDYRLLINREYEAVRLERDPPLTQREWNQLEIARGSYASRRA
jgi:hypothetical protein